MTPENRSINVVNFRRRLFALLLVLAACSSSSDAGTEGGDTDDAAGNARTAVEVDGQDVETDDEQELDGNTAETATGSVANDSSPETFGGNDGRPPEVIIEPVDALPGSLAGWELVDSFFWEPGGASTTDCDALGNFLDLQEWGLPTEFYVQGEIALAIHLAEVNTIDRAELFRATAERLPEECSQASLDDGEVTIEPLNVERAGFAMTIPTEVEPSWLFESDARVEVAVLQREAVVGVVTINDANGADNTDALLEIADLVDQRLAELARQ